MQMSDDTMHTIRIYLAEVELDNIIGMRHRK